MIKIAICDDEPIICSLYQTKVQFILKEHESEASIDTYTQPLKFLEALKVQEYDLILLDIDMPEISGLQLAEKIQELPKRPLLIFVTNQDALVYQTFLYHPFSFIRKSFLEEELETVLLQAWKELAGRKIRYIFRCEKRLYPSCCTIFYIWKQREIISGFIRRMVSTGIGRHWLTLSGNWNGRAL